MSTLKRIICISIAIIGCLLPGAWAQTSNKVLVILKQGDFEPIPTIIKNTRTIIAKANPQISIQEITFKDDTDAINSVKKINPNIILLVGKDIGKALAQNIPDTPIVISDMLRPAYIQTFPHDRIVVNSLYVPIETRIEYIQKILPNAKTISIVYSGIKNSDAAEEAEQYAQNHGLTIKKFPVDTEKDIQAISSLKADALLLIPDTLVCNAISLRHIMEISLQEAIPIMGISEYFAQTGTVMAISPNFDEYSKDLANTIGQLAQGAPVNTIPNTFATKVDYFINAAMAKVNKVNFNADVITGAKKVFGQ